MEETMRKWFLLTIIVFLTSCTTTTKDKQDYIDYSSEDYIKSRVSISENEFNKTRTASIYLATSSGFTIDDGNILFDSLISCREDTETKNIQYYLLSYFDSSNYMPHFIVNNIQLLVDEEITELPIYSNIKEQGKYRYNSIVNRSIILSGIGINQIIKMGNASKIKINYKGTYRERVFSYIHQISVTNVKGFFLALKENNFIDPYQQIE